MEYIYYFVIVIIVLSLSNLIRIKVKGSILLDVMRVCLFFVPFIIPVLFYGTPKLGVGKNIFIAYFISIFVVFLTLIIQKESFKPFLNKDIYYLMPLTNKMQVLTLQSSLLLSPFFEEILYRGYFPQNNIYIDTIFSGLLFAIVHLINSHVRENYKFLDYFILFLLGSVWYISFYISGSLWPAILAHLIYNVPNSVINFLRFFLPLKNQRI